MADNAQGSKGFLNLVWIRDLSITSAFILVTYKLAISDLSIDLSAFSFTDLLALIMALFSIWLSATFYFKNNDASSQFYNNSYKFTKETSEMLGRIEAGFGEKLSHIHESYQGLSLKIDRLPNNNAEPAAVLEQEGIVRQKELEKYELLNEFANRAQIAEEEKQEFLEKLEQTSDELQVAKSELAQLKEAQEAKSIYTLSQQISMLLVLNGIKTPASRSDIQEAFEIAKSTLSKTTISRLKKQGSLDNDGMLDDKILAQIDELLSRAHKK